MDRWYIEDKATGLVEPSSLHKVMEHARQALGTKAKGRDAVVRAQLHGSSETATHKYICKRGEE